MFVSLIRALGETAVSFAVYVGDVVMLAVETIGAAFAHKIRWRLFLEQIVEIGLRSQVVVMITGAFTGAVADRREEMGDSVREDPGLARAGAGGDEERPLGGHDGLPLSWVQIGEIGLGRGRGHSIRW